MIIWAEDSANNIHMMAPSPSGQRGPAIYCEVKLRHLQWTFTRTELKLHYINKWNILSNFTSTWHRGEINQKEFKTFLRLKNN